MRGRPRPSWATPKCGIVFPTYEKLKEYFEENPAATKAIYEKAPACAGLAAAKKARELVRRKNRDGQCWRMPGKLGRLPRAHPKKPSFTSWRATSAGGSAKLGRDSNIQAILPLWGKMC